MMPGMGGGMDPRQMSAMMKKLGIDVRDIEGVREVVVRTATADYVFDKASVSVMKAQGVETWQVSGKPRTLEHPSSTTATAPTTTTKSPVSAIPAPMPRAPAAPSTISEDDVALVMGETGKSRAEARAALEATQGDLAEAILKLSQG